MKNTIFIFIVSAVFMLGAHPTKAEVQHKYILNEIKPAYPINMPIDDEREAIEYAKDKMPFKEAVSVFSNIQEQHALISGWIVVANLKKPEEDSSLYAKQFKNGILSEKMYHNLVQKAKSRGKYWSVRFSSQGTMPSYQWVITFSPNGDIFSNEHRWNK